MALHGALRDAELGGDARVAAAERDEFEQMSFPVAQGLGARLEELGREAFAAQAVLVHGRGDGGEELLVVDGLEQKVDRAALEALDRGVEVAVAREEDDGQLNPALLHRLLKFEAAHARHAHVEDEAAGRVHILDKELPRARVAHASPAFDLEHQG